MSCSAIAEHRVGLSTRESDREAKYDMRDSTIVNRGKPHAMIQSNYGRVPRRQSWKFRIPNNFLLSNIIQSVVFK
jgi:hypothetical protein